MRATLNADGELRIAPETALEAFALKKWADEYFIDNPTCRLVVERDVALVGAQQPRAFIPSDQLLRGGN